MLARLASAIDELVGADPAALGDGESLVELQRELSRLEAVATRATGSFDADRGWEADGARTAAAWLSGHCRLPEVTARRRVRLGRALRHLPATEAAWLAGELHAGHVSLLAAARTDVTAGVFARDEAGLVDHARRLRFGSFARLVGYWCQCADPDGAEARAQARRAKRRLQLSQSIDGLWFGEMVLDEIGGTIVRDALRRIEDDLFAEDWAEAKARVGEGVSAADLARTAAQRRADALVELATRAMTAPAGGRRPEPLFTVYVGWETLAGRLCELANGTVTTPGSLVPWLDRAWLERVVFDGPSRVTDLGAAQRLFTGATRRAVQLRDRACFHDLCDEPAEHCEIDHIQPAATGGPTTQDNGRVACGYHNRLRHRRPKAS